MRYLRIPYLLLLIILCNLQPASASHPEQWVTSGVDDFLKGDFKGVSLTSDGRILLAPPAEVVLDTKEAYIHSMVANAAGTIFVGTSVGGKIFRIPAGGQGGEFAKFEEPGVYALALDPQNRLYAGTSPGGKVYRLSSEGKPETFFDPDEKFIWDLTFDEKGNLYVATGPEGVIYKVTPAGEGSKFFDSEETHIVHLAWDLNRNLLAGSSPGGILYRLDASGKPFVLLDSSLEEVKAIAVDRYGIIYAGALSGGNNTAKAQSENAKASTAKASDGDSATTESTIQSPASGAGGKMEVYRIDKDGLVEPILTSDSQAVFDLVPRNDGSVLLGTGNKGRIIAVDRRGFAQLLVDTPEEQITEIREVSGGIAFATSNLGKVYRVSAEAGATGTFESEVLDADLSSRWGQIRWRLVEPSTNVAVKLMTRSGNTKKPDRTWEAWSEPYAEAGGSRITSSPGRYLQWKVEFSAASRSGALISQKDALDWVSVSYQQANLPPALSSLTTLAAGVGLARVPGNPAGGVLPGGPDGEHADSLPKAIRDMESPKINVPSRRIYLPGSRSFTWKASDPNDDPLVFSVYVKREDQTEWLMLKKDLSDPEYTIDGASLGDGTYSFRVVASDWPGNPPGRELTDELVSKPFVVALIPPSAEWANSQVSGKSATFPFVVKTGTAPLYQVDFSVDDGAWRVAYPEDGVADSSREQYQVKVDNLLRGQHQFRIRMVDSVGNVSASAKTFNIE